MRLLRRIFLSKWFGYGLVVWCAGFLWFDAWRHHWLPCIIQFGALLVACYGLRTNGYNEAMEWSNRELDKLIERTKKQIGAVTAPKEAKNTWLV